MCSSINEEIPCCLKHRNSVLFTAEILSEVFFSSGGNDNKADDELRSVAVENDTASPDSITPIKVQWERDTSAYFTTAQWRTTLKSTSISHFPLFFPFLYRAE